MHIEKYIDHTILKATTTLEDIHRVCNEAIRFHFAAVCIPPLYVKTAKALLEKTDIKTATVIGFPLGYAAIESKVAEIVLSLVDGADELDMVANIAAIKNGDWSFIANKINTILPSVRNKEKCIKIIIESGVLTEEEIIKCCGLYGAAGIDYLKTSTGFVPEGASVNTVRLMRNHLPASVRIKASGGIKSYGFALELIAAGADRLGTSSSVEIMKQAGEAMA